MGSGDARGPDAQRGPSGHLRAPPCAAIRLTAQHRLVDLQSQQAKRVNERRAEEAKAAKEKSAAGPEATDGAPPDPSPSKEPAASEAIVIESDSDDDNAGMEWAADEMMQA